MEETWSIDPGVFDGYGDLVQPPVTSDSCRTVGIKVWGKGDKRIRCERDEQEMYTLSLVELMKRANWKEKVISK